MSHQCIVFLGTLWLLCAMIRVQLVMAQSNVVVVVISQPSKYHDDKAELLKRNIDQQQNHLNSSHVYLTHKDFPDVPGAWTIFPLLERLAALHNGSWIFFCEDVTQINMRKLVSAVSDFDVAKDYFLGYTLKDSQSTIIHHFDSTDDDTVLLYPDTFAGFFISPNLVKSLAFRLHESKTPEFSIDSKYEFAKFLWNDGRGTKLISVPFLCLLKSSDNCATWVNEIFPDCGPPIPNENLYFAVKTCQKFHKDRVMVAKNTWAKDCSSVSFFSDVEDLSIPTVNVGVENVPNGHCKKTLSILQYVHDRGVPAEWVIIADDDTLFSVKRLQKLLSCYDAANDIALGERYAYGIATEQGYNYITGGGGMVFSMTVVKKLISFCMCPSADSPDDMIIGLCLRNLGIPILHSPYFHQARPEDYPSDYLNYHKPVSFHKHWMTDPFSTYKEWLEENDSPASSIAHTEL